MSSNVEVLDEMEESFYKCQDILGDLPDNEYGRALRVVYTERFNRCDEAITETIKQFVGYKDTWEEFRPNIVRDSYGAILERSGLGKDQLDFFEDNEDGC